MKITGEFIAEAPAAGGSIARLAERYTTTDTKNVGTEVYIPQNELATLGIDPGDLVIVTIKKAKVNATVKP